jgi:hypothetical protein
MTGPLMESVRRGEDREMNLALQLGAGRMTGPLMESVRRGEDREMNLALRLGAERMTGPRPRDESRVTNSSVGR